MILLIFQKNRKTKMFELQTMEIENRKRAFTLFKMTTKTENCSNIKQNKNVKYMKINLTAKKQLQYTKS